MYCWAFSFMSCVQQKQLTATYNPKIWEIAYINDQKSILCAKKEKAPDKDETL